VSLVLPAGEALQAALHDVVSVEVLDESHDATLQGAA